MAQGMTTTSPQPLTWSGSDIDVNAVERQLSVLWKQMTQSSSLACPVRASVFNLVVYASSEDWARRVCASLRQLAQRKPSRTVVLVSNRRGHARSSIDAEVRITCESVSSERTPQCLEEIIIWGHGRAADHLSSVVIPLIIPELPTYLWWPSQPPFGQRYFHRLLSIADQLVIDSGQFQSPGDGLADVARLTKGRQGVNDFTWARLTPWREVVAQFFDGPTWVPYASGIISVRLEFGSGESDCLKATACTLLLVGWMASQLGWQPETALDVLATGDITFTVVQGQRLIPVDLHFRDHGAEAAGKLMSVELVSQPKAVPPARFGVYRQPDLDRAEIRMEIHDSEKISRVVPLDVKGDVELLADELQQAHHDRLYEQVVDAAGRLAGREHWVPA